MTQKALMKAAVVTRYGPPDVVKVLQEPKPAPTRGEILVRVHATTVNRTDWGELKPGFMRLFYGLSRPRRRIFGMEFAGEVEAVGASVTGFKPGDRVFGICPPLRNGAHAEYVCVPARGAVATMPADTPFEGAVICEGAYYADAGLKKYGVGPGTKVMIYGASGAIGTAAVQLAKAYGADVTAVVATPHLEMAKSIGADRVIDYTAEDFTRIPERFDYILDAVGKTTFGRCKRVLKPEGVFAATDLGPGSQNLLLALFPLTGRRKVDIPLQKRGNGRAFVEALRDLIAAGKIRAVIDRRYPLDAIADAYRHVGTGQKVGIVVIEVTPVSSHPASPP